MKKCRGKGSALEVKFAKIQEAACSQFSHGGPVLDPTAEFSRLIDVFFGTGRRLYSGPWYTFISPS